MSSDKGLKGAIESLFETANLYAVLGAEKSASDADLKKAYRKKSLVHHPDRPGGHKVFGLWLFSLI